MLHATLYKKKISLRVPLTRTFLLTTRVECWNRPVSLSVAVIIRTAITL